MPKSVLCLLSPLLLLVASVVVAPTAQADDSVAKWQQAVLKKIADVQIYPKSAIVRKLEGRAIIEVTLNKAGEIISYSVVEPTGEKVLDQQAEKMKDLLNPLPALPASIADNELTLQLPLVWRLT